MKNKYILAAALAAIMVLSVAFLPGVLAKPPEEGYTGNGSPKGINFEQIQVIGLSHEKLGSWSPGDDSAHPGKGNRIFVNQDGQTKIKLSHDPDNNYFKIIDADGTDGVVEIQLEDPYPEDDVAVYSIWIRELGQPGGEASMVTCGYDEYGVRVCSLDDPILLKRSKGKSTFRDETYRLTTILADLGYGDGLKRYKIFHDDLDNTFWDYDSDGLKRLQMRIYAIPPAEGWPGTTPITNP